MYALGPVVYILSDAVLALFFTRFRLLGVEERGTGYSTGDVDNNNNNLSVPLFNERKGLTFKIRVH